MEATQESGSTGTVTYTVVDDMPGGTDADPFTITECWAVAVASGR